MFVLLLLLLASASAEEFVRLAEVEMMSHPVTNAEYKAFVDGARYTPPQHWASGRVAAGMEQWPVVFVNRTDAAAYAAWRSRRENRIYRLPTVAEFELAARAGQPQATYPWGSENPEGHANFDATGDRTPDQWHRCLKPVKSYPPNPWGLYDMAGNVWQMVDEGTGREMTVMGGSWVRAASYLRIGVRGQEFPGIRHSDLGFRLVREPVGSARVQVRRLIASPMGGGAVSLSWQLLPGDRPDVGFHVYRSLRRDVAGERITTAPILDATSFADRDAAKRSAGKPVYYRVRPVPAGKEGAASEWASANPGAARSGVLAVFEPPVRQGGFTPVFGDLDGDGLLDAVLRLDNGIRESMPDPGVPIELMAFSGAGRPLWRRPQISHKHTYGNAFNGPYAVYDLDGDGKAEVIARIEEGPGVFLAVLDGLTGHTLRKTPWTKMVSPLDNSATRIHLAIARLDGKSPAIVTQTGLYENEILNAYDVNLKSLWEYKSFGDTSGSGSHRVEIADVDGDGKDEVFDGTTLLNHDGTVRWSIYREHPDVVAINHILPGIAGRQVFFGIESNLHAGAYLVDARTGKGHWKVNRESDPRWVHAHMGWVADIWDGFPGREALTNRDGHWAKDQVLFAADGKILSNPFPPIWSPVNWTGNRTRDLLSDDGRQVGQFDGKQVVPITVHPPNELSSASDNVVAAIVGKVPGPIPPRGGNCNVAAFGLQFHMVADLAGDFRDEVVCFGLTSRGTPAIFVFNNLEPIPRREITRTASREYGLWLARNMGGGYPSYFEWEPE